MACLLLLLHLPLALVLEQAQQQHAHLQPRAQLWVQPSFGAVAISQTMALVLEQHSCALRGLLEPTQR